MHVYTCESECGYVCTHAVGSVPEAVFHRLIGIDTLIGTSPVFGAPADHTVGGDETPTELKGIQSSTLAIPGFQGPDRWTTLWTPDVERQVLEFCRLTPGAPICQGESDHLQD